MRAKHLLFVIFWFCFLGAYSVKADDEDIIKAQSDKAPLKIVQVGQLSEAQSINIIGNPGINLVTDANNSNIISDTNITNNASPSLKPAKPTTHDVSIVDRSDRSKKSFELSHETPKTGWLKNNITGAQSIDPKAGIKISKKLQDLEIKRKNMKASRKRKLESRPLLNIAKPNLEVE